MDPSAAPRATACAIAHAAPPRARRGAGIAALILTLLARLFARTEVAWNLPPNHADHQGSCSGALVMPAIGRAPHAAVIEAGLVPDWILPGIRNRGMSPAAAPMRARRRARPARAPPAARPS